MRKQLDQAFFENAPDLTQASAQWQCVDGLLDICPDPMCIAEKDGRIIRTNKRFRDALGHAPERPEELTLFSVLNEDDIPEMRAALASLTAGAESAACANRCRTADGSCRYFDWRMILSGRFICAAARDITQKHIQEKKLRKLAYIDRLTGLFNRHYFDMRVAELIAESDIRHEPVSMISLDLDHFKNVNDTWGHPVGDEVLAQTAVVIGSTLRKSDMAARVGGEELAVVLPRTDLEGAEQVALKIKDILNSSRHSVAGIITASMGVAQRAPFESFEDWYRRADEGVYDAKRQGRNMIVCARPALDDGELRAGPVWDDSLSSGFPKIDGQHRELFRLGKRMLEMVRDDVSYEVTMAELERIISHVTSHFEDESAIIREAGYPDAGGHEKIHEELLQKVAELRDSYRDTRLKSPGFFSFIVNDLIIGHLKKEDAKFIRYFTNTAAPRRR